MIGLGIECTAHTLGIGIVRNGKVVANEKDSYTTEKGGIIPLDAAKHHEEIFEDILKNALKKTKFKLKEFDFVAVSIGPGLAPCLLAGLRNAKQLCKKLNKPLIPVNHCVAHLEVSRITGAKDPVMLYVSGANTQVIAYASGKFRVFGETLDIGAGNFIDNFARYSNIGFPGGPKIEKLAGKGKNYIELPYKVKGMDISLSGILTNLKQKINSNKYSLEDLSYSMQETVFSMLIEIAERALAHINKKELILAGGVACNSRLQKMAEIMCEERGAKFFIPSNDLLVDNGAMIAFLGEIMFKSNMKTNINDLDKIDIKPRQRTDEVDVLWR